KRQILHLGNSDVAETGNVFPFHEQVVRRLHPAPFAETRALSAGGFMPMDLMCNVVHVLFLIGWGSVRATITIASHASTRPAASTQMRLTKGLFPVVFANLWPNSVSRVFAFT